MREPRKRFGLTILYNFIVEGKSLPYNRHAESALEELVTHIQNNPNAPQDVFKSIALIISKLPDQHKYEAARFASISQKAIDNYNALTAPLNHTQIMERQTMLNNYNREMNKIATKFKDCKSTNTSGTMSTDPAGGALSAKEFVATLKGSGMLNFQPGLEFKQ